MTRAIAVLLLAPMVGCGDKDGSGDTGAAAAADDTASEGVEGWPDGQNCPDGVPEQFALTWDCQLNSCDTKDDTVYYKYAFGESTETGIVITEQFWVFNEDREWCMDEFAIVGEPETEWNVDTFNCSSCEEIWRYERTHTVQACGYGWTYTFNDKNNDTGVFNGVLMLDTHNSFGDRNPDDAALIYMVNFNSSWSDWDKGRSEWARGTVSPTGDEDGPPESYTWVSTATCF